MSASVPSVYAQAGGERCYIFRRIAVCSVPEKEAGQQYNIFKAKKNLSGNLKASY